MKHLWILAALLLATSNTSHGQRPLPHGLYLGQQPPGSTPVPFAPGLITSAGWEYGGTFSPDLEEFYFIREVDADTDPRQEFVVYRRTDAGWQETVISPRVGQPFISPDGKTMHLGRRYKKRSGDGWSEIKPLGAPFDDMPIMRLTASEAGTYFLDEPGTDGDGIVRYSRLIDGQHETPRPLPKEINTGTWNAHPFVAPDESYLIWDGRRDGGYGCLLYTSDAADDLA